MSTPPVLDPSIIVSTEGGVTRYIFPPRELGNPRGAAVALILFGLATAGFSIAWIISASGIFERHQGPAFFDVFRWIFALFGLPGLFFSCFPLLIGVGLLFPNHTEILLDDTHLIDREVAGPLRFTFRRPLKDLRVLHVAFQARPGQEALPRNATAGARYCAIWAEGNFKRRMAVAAAYPRDLLIPMAQALARQCALAGPAEILQASALESGGPKVEIDPPPVVEPDELAAVAPIPVPPQPAKSKILLMEDAGITSILIPRQGLKNPMAAFLLPFSVLWCAITCAVAYGILFGNGNVRGGPAKGLDVGSLLFVLLFSVIGLAMFLASLFVMSRKAVFVAMPESLTFSQHSIFGRKEQQWARGQITSVSVGDSGTKVNNRPLKQIQIHMATGRTVGLLTGRDDEELVWLSALLDEKCSGRTGTVN